MFAVKLAGLATLFSALLIGADSKTKVGIAIFPPNVMEGEAGTYTGFDIELWSEIARIAEIDYSYEKMPFEELLESLRQEKVEIGLAGITITGEREAQMDFSYPYMRSGLRILTRADQQPALVRLITSLPQSAVWKPFSYLLGFILVCAHILFFVERGSQAVSRTYFPGIFEAAWCIVATMTTVGYGDITPGRWLGRVVAFLVMVTGIGLFGILIAELSAGLTVEQMSAEISGPDDLRGRPVATVAGSTSVGVAAEYAARIIEVEVIDEAYRLIEAGKVEAVIFDAPALMQYVKQKGGGTLMLAGPLLEPQFYGIAFSSGSTLREPVNRALLRLRESNAYDQMYMSWFGAQPEM